MKPLVASLTTLALASCMVDKPMYPSSNYVIDITTTSPPLVELVTPNHVCTYDHDKFMNAYDSAMKRVEFMFPTPISVQKNTVKSNSKKYSSDSKTYGRGASDCFMHFRHAITYDYFGSDSYYLNKD